MPIGTIVNTVAVILGSLLGMLLHKNLPSRLKDIVFQGIGLSTLVIGIQMALKVENLLVLIFSVLIGGLIGEAINLERYLEKFSDFLKSKTRSKNEHFSEGLITAFLIYCVGSMTFIGTLNEGLRGDHSLLFTKSLLDGFTSIALASMYGAGVLFSAVPLFLFQTSLTLLAVQFQAFFTPLLVNQLTATGGVLILGIGLNLLEIKKIKVTNLLPALVMIVILTLLFG